MPPQQNKYTYIRFAAKGISILLVGIFLGWLLLGLAFCIPDNWIEHNATSALQQVSDEGTTPKAYVDNTQFDNFTVNYMLGIASEKNTGNPFVTALEAGHYYRYWHGYVVLLRPLLVVFSLTRIRMLMQFCTLILMTILSICLVRKLGRQGIAPAIIVPAAYYLFNIAQAVGTLAFFPSIALSLAFSIYIVASRSMTKSKLLLAFLVVGQATVYLDFLDTPILTLIVPLSLVIWRSICGASQAVFKTFSSSLFCCIAWGLGYLGMWSGKWILATIVLNTDVVTLVMNQASLYTTGTGPTTGQTISDVSAAYAISLNIGVHRTIFYLMAFLAVVSIVFLLYAVVKQEKTPPLICASAILSFLLCAVLPYVWYAALSGHSILHYWFTYRDQLGSLIALSLSTVYCLAAIHTGGTSNGGGVSALEDNEYESNDVSPT